MTTVFKWLKRTGIGIAGFIVVAYAGLWWVFWTSSVTQHGEDDLAFGNIKVPTVRTRAWADRSALVDSVTEAQAAGEIPQWGRGAARPLLARLSVERDIEAVNRILREAEPWGTVGSSGGINPSGNYDFTLCELSLLLYSYGDRTDILYPETVDHIVDVLMTEKGGDPIVWTPWMLGLPLRDTENHILMTEGSRYLTNRWIALHGNNDPQYDNVQNGLEAFLLEYLDAMKRAGLHEYNSRPYLGYTLRGLLNIESFGSDPVRVASRRVLDRMNWDYALGSLNLRRFPPFRRQPQRATDTDLDGDDHTAVIKAWLSLGGVEDLQIRAGGRHAQWVGLTSYRLPDATADWILKKPADYFVQIGHGDDGSPEINSGGPGYLVTAGGVANDRWSQAVARPTTLMLEDGATDLKELLQVSGPGNTFRHWNNTGVHRKFAVAAGPVSIPEGWNSAASLDGWSIYERAGQRIGVHSSDKLGMFCLLPEGEPIDLVEQLATANPDRSRLQTQFQWPGGSLIEYDVLAPKESWVIVSVGGKPTDRVHGHWPLMNGDVPGWVK